MNVQRLRRCLYGSPDLPALLLLPVEAAGLFRWEFQKFLRGSVWSLVGILFGFAGLACFLQLSVYQWLGLIVIAVLTWLLTLALTILGAVHAPRIPYNLLSNAFIVLILLSVVTGKIIGFAPLITLLDNTANVIVAVLPTAWVASLVELLVHVGNWWTLLLLVPICAAIWKAKHSLAALASGLELREIVLDEPSDVLTEATTEAKPLSDSMVERSRRLGVTAIEEVVRSRQFLAAPQWPQSGWFENLLWRWLTQREKALTEFVYPNGFCFTAFWKKMARHLVFASLIATVASLLFPDARLWIFGVAFLVPASRALSLFLDSGRAFTPTMFSGVMMPLYAGYAVGFRELARLLFKCSAVQLPLLTCLAIATSSVFSYLCQFPLTQGAVLGFKAALLLFAARFIFVTFSFSGGTNDASGFGIRFLLLLPLVILSPFAFLALGGVSLLAPNPLAAWLSFAAAVGVAYAFFCIYGWFYHANRFDLMRLPPRR